MNFWKDVACPLVFTMTWFLTAKLWAWASGADLKNVLLVVILLALGQIQWNLTKSRNLPSKAIS
jgi:hypothetical protein